MIRNRKNYSKWAAPVITVTLLYLLAVFVIISKSPSYINTAAAETDIETYYTFSGSVTSKNTQNVTANTIMQINEINVAAGDKVQKDTVLFTTTANEEIKSQISGTVSKIYVESGQQVISGELLCDIYDFDNLQVTVKIDEYDLGCISEGKNAAVTIHAIDKEVTGTVSSVSETAILSAGVAYFTAVIDLPVNDSVKIGMTAEAKILDKRVLNTLAIPMEFLQFDENQKPYVLIEPNPDSRKNSLLKGRTVLAKRYIKVGINDGKSVEIIEGLEQGQSVYSAAPDTGSNRISLISGR